MHRRTAPLGREVHIHRKERLLRPLSHPRRRNRLATGRPRLARRLDAPGVEAQRRPGKDLSLVAPRTGVELIQRQHLRTIQVRLADVPTGLAAVLVGDGVDAGEGVGHTAREGLDGRGEGGEGGVGGDDAVVGGAAGVLDLLDEDEVGGLEVGDDVGGDLGEVRGVGGEVLDVVVADGEGAAVGGGLEAGGRGGGGREGGELERCEGEDGVESEGVLDDAGNVLEGVAHLGGGGVFGAVEGAADEDGFWV